MIFVTGGTGLVGSHLLLGLVRQGKKVRALKRKTSDTGLVRKVFSWYTNDYEELSGRVEWVEGDILDYDSLEKGLEGVDIVYHCAAVVSFERKKRLAMIRNNVEGTRNLVNAALACGVGRICHVSSNSALGKPGDHSPVTEETKWEPAGRVTGYSESKFYSEAEIWRGVEEGLAAVVVNPSIIIGPGNWNNGSTGFFPVIYNGFRFYTRGTTGFVDVRDVVDALLLLTDDARFETASNRKYLISAENIGYYDLFCMIADALGKPRPAIHASGPLLAAAWRVAALWSLLSGAPARITRETVANSTQENRFDGSLITRMFGFRYRPVSEAITHTARCFLVDRQNKNHNGQALQA